MTNRSNTEQTPIYRYIGICIAILSLILATAMVVPVWTALSAGLTAISLILFSFLTVLLVGVFFADKRPIVRFLTVTAIIASVISVVVPQTIFLSSAKSEGIQLTFDPLSYLTFSGSSDIAPTSEVTYKTIANQKLKLAYYKPAIPGKRPVVVLLHGGAWRYGSHLEIGQWPEKFNDAGYAVVSVEYRLSNDKYHSWEDTPADVHDAINYIDQNADYFSIDPEQMHLMGQSAGGHLALLEAYRFKNVKSVTALYAPIDITLDYETSRDKSAELDFIGGPPKQYRERYRSLSPLTYLDRQAPRTLVIQGMYDDLVHYSQATRLGDALSALDVRNTVVLLPMTGHSFENQRGGFATQIATERILTFLK